jgi:hypothetical protein
MTETLDKLVSNREDNGKVLQKSETSMIKQISIMKSKLLKHIDELEQKFITNLTSIKKKKETAMEIRDAYSTANIIMLTTKIINLDVCMDLTVYLRRCWYS